MHFTNILFFAASALQIGSSLAQQAPACSPPAVMSALATYQPAQAFCSVRYPVKTVTVTVPKATATTTTTKSTSASITTGGGSVKTITSIVEKTVTDCRSVTMPSNCKFKGYTAPTAAIRNGPREAAPEPEPQWNNPFQAYASYASFWSSAAAKGGSALSSVCACIQAPAKTVTVTAR